MCDLSKHQRNVKVKAIGPVHNYIILANCWNHDQRPLSNGYDVHKLTSVHGQMWIFFNLLWSWKKWSTQQVIILANCWSHDRRSMSNSSRSYGVHKVTSVHGTMWENSKLFRDLAKGQDEVKVKTTGLVHNFIILANCWCQDPRSMSNC